MPPEHNPGLPTRKRKARREKVQEKEVSGLPLAGTALRSDPVQWFLRQSVISWASGRLLLLSVMHGSAWLNSDLCGIRVEIRAYLPHPRRRSRSFSGTLRERRDHRLREWKPEFKLERYPPLDRAARFFISLGVGIQIVPLQRVKINHVPIGISKHKSG